MRLFFLLTALIISFSFVGCKKKNSNQKPDETPITEYKLIWSDEFESSTTLNQGMWTYETGYGAGDSGWGNDEWQNYTSSKDNVTIKDGKLVITARCDTPPCGKRDGSITSARINTQNKFSFKYGKIAASIKAPAGQGMWPAFWMLGSNFSKDGWPKCGEIDIFEMAPLYHDNKTSLSTVHWYDDKTESHTHSGKYRANKTPLSDEFHEYEVEWNENQIIGKIDGIIFFTKIIDPLTMGEFQNDFFVILNVAVGGTLGGSPTIDSTWKQEMSVDWVRVYQKKTEPTIGIFSETHNDSTLKYTQIIDSNWWGGNRAVPNKFSKDVTPFEGDYVLDVEFIDAGTGWGGSVFQFKRADITAYKNLVFSINSNSMKDFNSLDIEIEDASGAKNKVQISSYTPKTSEAWKQFEIPLKDFYGVDFENILHIGFWNPTNSDNNLIFGKLYLDNIFLNNETSPYGTSIYFEKENYKESDSATFLISDIGSARSMSKVKVDNGKNEIEIDLWIDSKGNGTGDINFGETDDTLDTIEVVKGDVLTVTYEDSNEKSISDTADIIGEGDVSPEDNILVDFEDAGGPYTFNDFEGGVISVIENPKKGDLNNSLKVAEMKKYSGKAYAGSTLLLKEEIDFSKGSIFKMKVWSSRAVPVTFKLEGLDVEKVANHSGSSEWEDLTFDFSGKTGAGVTGITFIFDNGIVGDATSDPENWTFYFDNIALEKKDTGDSDEDITTDEDDSIDESTETDEDISQGENLSLDFEDDGAPYDFTSFDGGVVTIVENPDKSGLNTSQKAVQMVKNSEKTWGGAFLISDSPIDFSNGTVFKMKVWASRAVPILLKIEESQTKFVEITVNHSGSSTWEELTFDFSSENPSKLVDPVKIVFIFDNGVLGDVVANPDNWTFYFDDISQI